MRRISLFVLFFTVTMALHAKIRLPNLVSNGMVLQQQSDTKIWGWANPTEKVTLVASWNAKDTVNVTTDNNGKWQLILKTPAAGGPYTIDVKGENEIHLTDVWLGEVWVCSGQSNMEFHYAANYNSQPSTDISDDFNTCGTFQLHYFHVPKTTALYPQENCEGTWKAVDAESIKGLSAVSYFFGKKLNQNLKVPVGLITTSWGGTPAETWTPADVVDNNNTLKDAASKVPPVKWWPTKVGLAYNAMIAPVLPYQIAGVIWYQGESNVKAASTYAELFKTMIQAWRKNWEKEVPFYYVQIAPFTYGKDDDAAALRAAQAEALALPKTGMVITSDLVNDSTNIHPLYKHEVGYRLAYEALNKTYQQTQIDLFSPMFLSATVEKNVVKVNLSHAEKGLVAKGKQVKDAKISGDDGVFYPAQVKLEKGAMIFSSKQVKNPKAIQYGFDSSQMGNVFNSQGLPVAPFKYAL